MTLRKLLNKVLNEEDNYFPYLNNIMPYIKSMDSKNINKNNLNIINSIKNKEHYDDYFIGKSINQFKEEVINSSIQLRENPKNHISTKQQHLIIAYLNDYINQLKELKKKKILNFIE